MTPPLENLEGAKETTPREAVERLSALCDRLELLQVPTGQVEELRSLCTRFLSHIQSQPVFWQRLEDYARRQRLC
jgi:hypothetical protein